MEGRLRAQSRRTTPEQAQGPFYPVVKPDDRDSDLTNVRGMATRAQGLVIQVTGRVLNTQGQPVPGARVEIWQANAFGRYTHPLDGNPEPLDPGFQGYGVQSTDESGSYSFRTVKPASYPVGENSRRPPHIHFIVTGHSSRLVTQMYFEGETLNDTDPLLNSVDDRDLLIVKLSTPAGAALPAEPVARFDIVIAEH